MPESTSRASRRATGAHRFASIREAATYLVCDHKLVRQMIAAGQLTGYRLPGSRLIRIDLDELDAAIVASTRQAG